MEEYYNIEVIGKVIVGITGGLAAFGKLRETFASIRRKQELKLDLEILEKIRSNEKFDSVPIEEKINKKLANAFEDTADTWTNFLVGITVFVGFGFWTVDLFNKSESFNGWLILTLFCSLLGLSMLFSKTDNKKSKEVFYQIGFFDKANFQTTVIITLITGILTPMLIWKINGFSFWQFLSGLLFVIGIASLFKNIRRVKNSG